MASESTTGTSPEKHLLLCCARAERGAAFDQQIQALVGAGVDWAYLFAAALEQGVAPLLYLRLSATCPLAVPQFWLEKLRDEFESTARHNLYLTVELTRILELFSADGIPAIPYGGPVLAAMLPGAMAGRQFASLDMMLRQSHVARATELLLARGYRAAFTLTLAAAQAERVPRRYRFTDHADRVAVELHTERTLRFFPVRLDLEALSERLEPVCLGGLDAQTIAAEDLLPIFAVYASENFWEELSWLLDIAALAHSAQPVDWEKATERARELGAERILHLALYLTNDLLGTALPEEILRRAREDRVVRRLATTARERMLSTNLLAPGLAEKFLFRLQVSQNVLAGLRYCLRLATSPTEEDWSQVRWGGRVGHLLAAAGRPFRLFGKYGLARARVPATDLARYVPTPTWVIERMLELAEVVPADVVYDPGCGDGRVVVLAAKQFGARGVGVDVDRRRIAEAKANARHHGVEQRVRFLEGDAKTMKLPEATVVTLCLRLVGNARLGERLRAQLRPGARIVSRDYPLLDWPPEKTRRVKGPSGEIVTVYLWRVQAARTSARAAGHL